MKYILNHVNEGCGKSPLNDGIHVISNQLSIVCWDPVYWKKKKKHLKSPWKNEKIEENLSLFLFFQLRPVKSKFTGIDVY